jgi:TetR/AcrR family transcriptional regulator, transcriptional repressor for nem operon
MLPTNWKVCNMNQAQHQSRTKLLDASLHVIRAKGYAATRIEDVCAHAGLTKGSFFHHFKSKEELALAAVDHWSHTTGSFFIGAAYRLHADPLDRVLGYVDLRKAILQGNLADFTCLVGTMVQEAYETNTAIRDACAGSINAHAAEVAKDIQAAKQLYAPDAAWSAESLALYTQAVIQGAFILAKAGNGPAVAVDCLDHLRRYLQTLFANAQPKEEVPCLPNQ